jgi:nitroreductase
MNVTQAAERQMSVRAFRDDPVPGEIVREILLKAGPAPSGGNVQPWKVYALAGQPLEALSNVLLVKWLLGFMRRRNMRSIRPRFGNRKEHSGLSAARIFTAPSISLGMTQPGGWRSRRVISVCSMRRLDCFLYRAPDGAAAMIRSGYVDADGYAAGNRIRP